jgi:hypothetical protein
MVGNPADDGHNSKEKMMSNKPTYSGVQHQVRNSPKPPQISPSNPAWMNSAIASAGGKKR